MREEQTYRKVNWDWIFTLPFILLVIYLVLSS